MSKIYVFGKVIRVGKTYATVHKLEEETTNVPSNLEYRESGGEYAKAMTQPTCSLCY